MRFLSLDYVKNEVCGDDRVTQRELIETIVKRYPVLWPQGQYSTAEKAQDWANVCLALPLADVAMHSST